MQTNIKTIYVDMDGVLVDLYDPISIYLNEDYEAVKKRHRVLNCKDTKSKLSIVMPLLHEISSTDIFSRVRPNEGFNVLVGALKSIEQRGVEIKILSSVMKNNKHADNLRACKEKWLKNNGITWDAIFAEGRHDKRVYANESSLLIDDTRENIIDWTENEGYGIYHTSHKNTINYLYDLELL